ncbi:MAG: sensor domain-containing protein, partial [Micrococcales bacterium]|nr:sensor domain-containing protein [Micrococcales bacterium]
MSSTTMTRDDVRVVAPALCGWRALAFAPLSPATWRAYGQAAVGCIWLWCAAIVGATLVSVGAMTSWIMGVGLILLVATMWLAHWFAVAEAARLTAQTGVDVVAAPRRRNLRGGFWRTFLGPLADGRSWAALGYAALSTITSTLAFALIGFLGAVALAGVAAPLYLRHHSVPVHTMADFMANVGPVPTAVVGLVLVWFVPVIAQAFALLQV